MSLTSVRTFFIVGVLLYELLTGQKPMRSSGSLIEDIQRKRTFEADPPHSINKKLDADVSTVTLKALHPDRTQRYYTAGNLADDLKCLQDGEPVSAREPTLFYKLSRRYKKHRLVSNLIVCLSLHNAHRECLFWI